MSYIDKANEVLNKIDEVMREMVVLGFFPRELMEDAEEEGYDRNELGFVMMELMEVN